MWFRFLSLIILPQFVDFVVDRSTCTNTSVILVFICHSCDCFFLSLIILPPFFVGCFFYCKSSQSRGAIQSLTYSTEVSGVVIMVHVAQSVGVNAVKTRLSWPCPRQPWLCPHDSGLGSHPSACSSLALSCRCFIGSRLVSQMFLLFANEISVRASISILHCVCPHKLDLTRRRVFFSLSLCVRTA